MVWMAMLAGLALASTSAPGEEPPWAMSRWAALEPTLIDVEAEPDSIPPTVRISFHRAEAIEPVIEAPRPYTFVVRWRSRPDELPLLPPPAPPIVDWQLEQDGYEHRLVMHVVSAVPASLELAEGGWHVVLGRARRAPEPTEPTASPDLWVDAHPELWEAEDQLHRSVREARRGDWGTALTRLASMSDGSRPLLVQSSAYSIEGQLLIDAGLPLLAIEPLARAARLTPDASQAGRALRHLHRIARGEPDALAFAMPHLRQTWREGTEESWWLALEVGRSWLTLGRPSDAAPRFLEAYRSPRYWREARYLAHVAARLAGDTAAAWGHLDTLAATLPPSHRVRVEAELGRARLMYDTGDLSGARERYRQLVALAPTTKRARVELAWLDLRAGDDVDLSTFVPFDLDLAGVGHALLVGAVYHQRCYPTRASAIATQVLEWLATDPLLARLDAEVAATDTARWASSRERLVARAGRYTHQRRLDRATRSVAFYRREALKLRFSADARRGDEVRTAWRDDVRPPAAEPPFRGWRGSTWSDSASAGLVDRCAILSVERPMPNDAAPNDAALVPAPTREMASRGATP